MVLNLNIITEGLVLSVELFIDPSTLIQTYESHLLTNLYPQCKILKMIWPCKTILSWLSEYCSHLLAPFWLTTTVTPAIVLHDQATFFLLCGKKGKKQSGHARLLQLGFLIQWHWLVEQQRLLNSLVFQVLWFLVPQWVLASWESGCHLSYSWANSLVGIPLAPPSALSSFLWVLDWSQLWLLLVHYKTQGVLSIAFVCSAFLFSGPSPACTSLTQLFGSEEVLTQSVNTLGAQYKDIWQKNLAWHKDGPLTRTFSHQY